MKMMRNSGCILCIFLYSYLIFLVAAGFNSSSHYYSKSSIHVDECEALLKFSNSLPISSDTTRFCFLNAVPSYPKTASWKNGTDCCSWDGVACHAETHTVIGLDLSCSHLQGSIDSNSTLFSLPNLQWLNLVGNNFMDSQISPMFGIFTSMTHLNISHSGFSGPFPVSMFSQYLSGLISLDLSDSGLSIEDEGGFRGLIRNLTKLEELVLDYMDMSTISAVSLRNLSSTLTSLSLLGCDLPRTFPNNIFRLPNLRSLLLSNNPQLTSSLPLTNWTGPLVSLDVSFTNFYGSIPYSMGNLTSLEYLDISGANFSGTVPQILGRITSLAHLDLSNNRFSGTVDFEMFASLRALQYLSFRGSTDSFTLFFQTDGNCSFLNLKVLDLSSNNNLHSAGFPYFLKSSTELQRLYLHGSNIGGNLPELHWKDLDTLMLGSNEFVGEIPSSFCQMTALYELELSNNSLTGTIPACFGNLSRLQTLDLSQNQLRGPLPSSLANCTDLGVLKVGDNEMTGTFPCWLNASAPSLGTLDLHSNKFHGVIHNSSFSWLETLDISGNNFEGPLPIPPPDFGYYIVKDNNFSGHIPRWICDADRIRFIDVSNNSLTGPIPDCFKNLTSSLQVIRLSQNQLRGSLPRSLSYCEQLEILDVSQNKLNGRFPNWLETLPKLKVLVLRSNKFHGLVVSANKTDQPFQELRILDLSNNYFSGPLPAMYIASLVAMRDEESIRNGSGPEYIGAGEYYSVTVVMKGITIELVKILIVFTTTDFSSNFFEGEIPVAVGELKALKGLNLSHNNLNGTIPSSIGRLSNLEWLDLSSNRLEGKIPSALADLSFLSFLNLSLNQLVGPIPRGTQIATFKNDSFLGNPGLCGDPLPKACSPDSPQSPTLGAPEGEVDETEHWVEWRAVLMGLGCGLLLGISIFYIIDETGRPWWLAKRVERLCTIKTNKGLARLVK